MRYMRNGFTLIELMMVVCVIGLVLSMTYPRVRRIASAGSVRSAKQEAAAYLVRARAAAIQQGRQSRFVRAGNTFKVTVDSSGTQVLYARALDTNNGHGVVFSATRDTIVFDPRGFAVGLSTTQVLRFSRDGVRDSLCVGPLGRIASGGCAP